MKNEGFYLDRENWKIEINPKNRENKIKIPILAALSIAPILGALLVVFLPFLGFALLGKLMIQKMYLGLHNIFNKEWLNIRR